MAKKLYELQPNDEVRESADNTCHQTTNGFSPWFATLPIGYTFGDAQPTFDSTTSKWTWYVEGSGVSANAESGASTASATSATFTFTDGEGEGATKTFTATRFAAVESTENENFVTKSYVASQFSGDNTSLMGVVRYTNAAKSGSDMAATTAYATGVAYAVGDYILQDSTNYVCITAVTAAANTDWDTVAASFAARTAKTAQMADRTTNAVTVTNATMNITFPAAVTDKMRDFLVYIDATGYVAGGKFTVTLPTGADQYGDDFPAITATGEHLVAITEIAAGKFYVRAIELEEVE